MPFFHLQQHDSTKERDKTLFEDRRYTHSDKGEKKSVCVRVCLGVCDYFIFHGNLNGRWRPHTHMDAHTDRQASQCCGTPDALRDCNNSWSQPTACWTRQMELYCPDEMAAYMCVYVCCVFVCLCVCVSVCLRATRPVSTKEKQLLYSITLSTHNSNGPASVCVCVSVNVQQKADTVTLLNHVRFQSLWPAMSLTHKIQTHTYIEHIIVCEQMCVSICCLSAGSRLTIRTHDSSTLVVWDHFGLLQLGPYLYSSFGHLHMHTCK